jgi:hypothetical protein
MLHYIILRCIIYLFILCLLSPRELLTLLHWSFFQVDLNFTLWTLHYTCLIAVVIHRVLELFLIVSYLSTRFHSFMFKSVTL